MNEPRDEHYFFAHEFLKEFYFKYYGKLNSEIILQHHNDMDSFIRFLWFDFQRLSNFAKHEVNGYEELSLEVNDYNEDMEQWIITMPKPENKTEAYYIGFLLSKDEKKKIKNPLYFTLEYTDEDNSFFCFWDKSERHHNHGLVEPTKDAFVESIERFYGN
jgi:hypothetical protein